jgi:hypothetical protein
MRISLWILSGQLPTLRSVELCSDLRRTANDLQHRRLVTLPRKFKHNLRNAVLQDDQRRAYIYTGVLHAFSVGRL